MTTTASSNNNRSLLDRSIQIILPHPDPTPSNRAAAAAAGAMAMVSPDLERLHRLHGTSLIATACRLLCLKTPPEYYYATACTILHRFYHVKSLQQYNVWSVAMAATVLAAKLTDDDQGQGAASVSLPKVILVFQHIYRRRLLLLLLEDDSIDDIINCTHVAASSCATTLSLAQKQERLRRVPPCSPVGPLYNDWYQAVVQTENMVLRALGFTLYWIPDQQPQKYCLAFLKVLLQDNNNDNDNNNKSKSMLAQRACKYCNQACRLDLCTRFDASVIACAAIYLALLGEQQQVPPTACWWDALCGKGHTAQDMATICNAILGLEHEKDARIASVAFVPSISGVSFNDPGTSFVWEMTEKELTGVVNDAAAATSG